MIDIIGNSVALFVAMGFMLGLIGLIMGIVSNKEGYAPFYKVAAVLQRSAVTSLLVAIAIELGMISYKIK